MNYFRFKWWEFGYFLSDFVILIKLNYLVVLELVNLILWKCDIMSKIINSYYKIWYELSECYFYVYVLWIKCYWEI